MNQNSFHCPQCQQMRLFQQQTMNHTPHILASVFLCGLWLPIWALIGMTFNPPWRCAFCGYTDRTEYLCNPQLKQVHAQQTYQQAQIRAQTLADRSGSTFQEQVAYFIADHKFPIGLAGALLLVIAIASIASVFTKNTSGTSTTDTPTVATQKASTAADKRIAIANNLAEEFRKQFKDVAVYGDGYIANPLIISSSAIDDRVVREFTAPSNSKYLDTLRAAGFTSIKFKNLKREWDFVL
jgi:hypothetical protein